MTELTQSLLQLCADAEGCDLKQMMFEYLTNFEFKRRIDLIALSFDCPINTGETIH